jgi:hypothetical protein
MAAENVEHLRNAVMRYKEIDDRVIALNRQITPLRDARAAVKDELLEIIRLPAFANYEKLDIREDGSSIKIRKPGWQAPWSLPKMRMNELIRHYFDTPAPHNANSCIAFINQRQNAALRKETYDIERIVRE